MLVKVYTHFVDPLSTEGRLGCFHLLAFVNNTTVDVGLQIFVLIPAFNSFMFIPRKWNCWIEWYFYIHLLLRNYHTIFHNGCTILHFHQ